MDFANAPLNLAVTTMKINRSKGDKGPDEWSPQNPMFACQHLEKFNSIIQRYKIVMITAEKKALTTQAKACNKNEVPCSSKIQLEIRQAS